MINTRKYISSDDHENSAGHRGLDSLLDDSSMNPNNLSPESRLSVLRAAVERLPWYRDVGDYKQGERCYDIVVRLFAHELPYSCDDVCNILRNSKHGCGHGSDVTPAYNLLLSYAYKHGINDELLDAAHTFIDGLKGLSSTKANNLKSKSELLFLLDKNVRQDKKCEIRKNFAVAIADLEGEEKILWHRFVLQMNCTMQHKKSAAGRKADSIFVRELGEEKILRFAKSWWPSAKARYRIDTGVSHLLKNFCWLIQEIRESNSAFTNDCDELMLVLSQVEWQPVRPALKVLIQVAYYFAECPPEIAWAVLLEINRVFESAARSPWDGDKIGELVRDYAQRMDLIFP